MITHLNQNPTMNSETVFFEKIYWLNQLSGELPETNFIPDFTRPKTYLVKNNTYQFELSENLSQSIIKLTGGSHLSTYLFLLTGFKILLYKYTGNQDILVGSPVYKQEQTKNQILPLRSVINNQLTCKEFLLQVKDTVISAYSHQNYPFEELVKLLEIPPSLNRCLIFDLVILLENIHNSDQIANLHNDLTFSFAVVGDEIKGKIEYNDNLFRKESIEQIAKSYLILTEGILQNFNAPISNLILLTENEQQQLLETFNNNNQKFPVEKTIPNLFEEQVKQTPDKIAAIDNQTKITYQQLDKTANQLARLIQKLGIKSGDLVGIFKQRDIKFLVGILAILKAGGAYVPIDSNYPPERVQYMLSNSEVKILLTDSSCLQNVTHNLETCEHLKAVVCLDETAVNQDLSTVQIYTPLAFQNLPTTSLQIPQSGIDPAYMIYTSGSTGLPKGAMIRHGGAINHIYAQFHALELNEEFTFLQSAPASSDISVWQFLAPILIGGKTVIIDSETVCQPQKLFQIIQQQKVSLIELVPVVLNHLLDYVSQLIYEERALPELRWMMVTGESVSIDLVNRWLKIYPEIKVINAFGPTEAADDITQFIIDKPLPENQRTVPIGKPLANLNLYILDAQMQLVPVGVMGEICVSGFGVGLGYWKNEAATQRSFIPNPFTTVAKPLPGTETDFIYKTGDLGRWLPDGNIEFFGRIDHQVKIRGFRIELGEIEALLSQYSGVKETVVIAREDTPGDKRLVAYLVSDINLNRENILQLRQFLKEKLPEYMLPSAFVFMESLPLTPSGKVDRKALPAPPSNSELEVKFVPPRTPTEQIVADIWGDILGQEKVGIYDNFFNLGGHSLLATQVISRLREAFKIDLPLRSLFEQPTVAQLVETIEKIITLQQLQTVPVDPTEDREEIEF